MRLALSLAFIAACTATSDQDTVAQAVTGTSACAPLDYGPRPAPDALYRFFADDAEAGTYAAHLNAVHPYAQAFGEITKDERLNHLVAEAFRGFQLAFPRETAGITTPPFVATVEATNINAFVLPGGLITEPGYDKAPWIFFVTRPLVDLARPDDELIGVFAHEMGHLIIRNYAPEVRNQLFATYAITGASENAIVGSEQPNDDALLDRLNELSLLRLRVGNYPELGFGNAGGLYSRVLLGSCPTANSQAQTLLAAVLRHVPMIDGPFFSVTLATEDAELEQKSADLVGALRTCAATSKDTRTIAELIRSFGYPDTDVLDAEHAADADPTLATLPARILALEPKLRARAVELSTNPATPIERVRAYDVETDSDDAAARVLFALGRDVTGNGRFALNFMTPAAAAACQSATDLAFGPGALIEYGHLVGTHPALCWRYFHAVQLAKKFATCTPGTTPRKPAGGASLPALTPDEVLEITRPE